MSDPRETGGVDRDGGAVGPVDRADLAGRPGASGGRGTHPPRSLRWLLPLALIVLGVLLIRAWPTVWRGEAVQERRDTVEGGGTPSAAGAGAGAATAPVIPGFGGYPAPTAEGEAYPAPAALRAIPLKGGLPDDAPAPLDPAEEPGGAAAADARGGSNDAGTDAPRAAGPTGSPAPRLSRAQLLARLRAPLPARDPQRLARELGQLRGPVARPTPSERKLGDRDRFWLHDINASAYMEVEARLVAISPQAYGWLQEGESADEAALRRGVEAFSTEVLPRLRRAFGHEASPGVDGDPRIHILHHQPIAGVAGYYYSVDQQPRAVDPHSNAREMFYINLDSFTPGSRDYLALLAHEFQHMVHWNQDPSESVWLNEGLSELAPHLVGLGVQTGRLYLGRPDTPLLEWTGDSGSSAEHYAAAFAFCAYLWQRYGEAYLAELLGQQANGAAAVEAAARILDPSAPSFDTLFLEWTVANLLPEELAPALPPRYRQAAAVDLRVDPEPLPPLPARSEVGPFGVDYWDLTPLLRRGSLRLDFAGDRVVPLLSGAEGAAAPIWWSGRDENMASTLGLALTPRAGERLEGRLWYQLEEDWDYAYLQASGDGGETWQSLRLAGSRTENPNGNNLGLGLSGQSQGWEDWSLDLAPYAGRPLGLRWLVLTDDAVSESGLALDGLRRVGADGQGRPLPAEDPAWQAAGWQLLPLSLPARWGLQVVVRGHESLAVRRFGADAQGQAAIALDGIPDDATVTLIVSAMTPGTRSSAAYRLAAAAR